MIQRENRLFPWLGDQADAREGVMSFVERRAPEWSLNPGDLPSDLLDE